MSPGVPMDGTAAPIDANDPGRVPIARLGLHTAAAKLVLYGLTAVATVLAARALGPAGRGRYYLPLTMVTMAFWLGNLGAEQAQLRAWARRAAGADAFITASRALAGLLGVGAATAAAAIYFVARDTTFAGVSAVDVAIVLAVLPVHIHARLLTGLLTVNGRLRQANLAWVVGAGVQATGAVALFVADWLTVTAVLVLYDLSVVVPWLLLLAAGRAVGRFHRPVPWPFVWSQLRLGAAMHPSVVFLFLNVRLDIFLVARYRGLDEVGLYSVAATVAELTLLLTDAVVWSATERQVNASEARAIEVTVRAVRMNLLLWAVVGAVIAAGSPVFVPLLFGQSFAPAQEAVWALLAAGAGLAVWRPVSTALSRLASPALQASVGVAALATNVAANVALVPRFGIVGAGLASVASYWLGAAAVVVWLVRRQGVGLRELVPARADVRRLAALVRPD